ncbi:hypothetical protein Tco_0917492 [Tanacetum coccineum]
MYRSRCTPEYIPPEDDVFLAEEQPLHAATSPTAESPGYIPESDPEEDPEEDPADYPADRDDDDEEEEEEHPAPADFVPPVHRMTARISIRDEPSISLPPREEVERLLALTTPPPSPLTPLSSPLPQIPSPPLPIPSPPPNSPTHIEIPESCLPLRKRVRFASPTPSREVGESSAAGAARQDRPTIAREDLYGFVDMVDVPPRCSTSRELDYDITDTWDDLVGAIDEIAPTTVLSRQTQIYQSVKTLFNNSQYHYKIARLLDKEALVSPEARGAPMWRGEFSYALLGSSMVFRQLIDEALLLHWQHVMQPGMGDDSPYLGTGCRRPVASNSECTYLDFLNANLNLQTLTEINIPPRKRLGIDLGPRYEIGESSVVAATRPVRGRREDYGFVGTMDTEIRRRRAEEEALVSREAWGRSIEVSYMTRSEIMALRSVVMGQQAVISQLQAADRRSQVVTSEMLQADHQRQVQLTKALKLLKGLQTQMAELQRQHGPAKGPAQPDAPGEAGSSS